MKISILEEINVKPATSMMDILTYLETNWYQKNEQLAKNFYIFVYGDFIKFKDECYRKFGYNLREIENYQIPTFSVYDFTVRYVDKSQISEVKFWEFDANGHREVMERPKKHLFGFEHPDYPGTLIGIELDLQSNIIHKRNMLIKSSQTDRMMAGRDHVFYHNIQNEESYLYSKFAGLDINDIIFPPKNIPKFQ